MNTPIYAQSGITGIKPMGRVGSSSYKGHSSMLPPSYSGRWDDFTPWDTENEIKEKKRQAEEAEKLYQEQLANIASSQPAVTKPSPVLYILLGLAAAGILYSLSKS